MNDDKKYIIKNLLNYGIAIDIEHLTYKINNQKELLMYSPFSIYNLIITHYLDLGYKTTLETISEYHDYVFISKNKEITGTKRQPNKAQNYGYDAFIKDHSSPVYSTEILEITEQNIKQYRLEGLLTNEN